MTPARVIVETAIGTTGAKYREILERCPELTVRQVDVMLRTRCRAGEWVYVHFGRYHRTYFLRVEDAALARDRLALEYHAHREGVEGRRKNCDATRQKKRRAAEVKVKTKVAPDKKSARKTAPTSDSRQVTGMDTAPCYVAERRPMYRSYVDPAQRVPGGFADMGIGRYLAD